MEPINREHDPRWEVLALYVRDIADRMGLQAWDVWVDTESPAQCGPPDTDEAEILATCSRSFCSLSARFRFSDAFFEIAVNQQRHMVVHELVHVIDGQRDRIINSLESCGALSSREYGLFNMSYEYATENVVDWIARLLSPNFPLILWEESDASIPLGG